MAEVQKDEGEEQALPQKRKSDLTKETERDEEDDSKKKQKQVETCFAINSSIVEEKGALQDNAEADDDDDDDAEDYEGDDDDDDEEDDRSNGEADVDVDHKGKGILREDKGKGKLIEESVNSSDCESDGDDTDLSDDPLAEVDLDNILPSRTRRRVVKPGVYISNDLGKHDNDDDSDA